MTPEHDMTWRTVTLNPGIEVKTTQTVSTMMSPCGRVLLAIQGNQARVYRRCNNDGDYQLSAEIDLT